MPTGKGSTTFAALSLSAVLAGCQSAPAQFAGTGIHATYAAAETGVGAVRATGMGLYNGAGTAIRAPLHDLNLMQDQIAPVLLRAESHPYDLAGVNSCNDVLNRVSELDLALGPDVDTPKQRHRTRVARGADFAAAAALDAAGSAAEHFIPMRSTLRQLSGAKRYDDHVKHAILAGETRRSFLKAVGMAHNCTWPAAPLDFSPPTPAAVDALWVAPAPSAPAVMVASVQAPAPAPGLASASARPAVRVAQVTLISAAKPGRPLGPVKVAVAERLSVPSALPPPPTRAQTWRPAASSRMVMVSTPLTTTASMSSAAAPWSQGFATASVHP